MPAAVVFAVYGGAIVVALAVLYHFHATHWYWHVFSVLVALAAGLIPLPAAYRTPGGDLAVGGVVVFLLMWGICAPLFRDQPHQHHAPPRHA